jgi:transposase-like protein
MCPFCKGRHVDPAVAIIDSVKISWHCRECDRTWSLAETALSATRIP